jgi:hypothetical protein
MNVAATTTPEVAAPDAALEVEVSDEQLWNEIAADEGTPEPEEAADDEPESAFEETDADDQVEVADGKPQADEVPQLERLRHQLNSEKGRTQALTRKSSDLTDEVARLQALLNDSKPTAEAKLNRVKLTKAREEYGDVIGPLADQMDVYDKRMEGMAKANESQLQRSQKQLTEFYQEQTEIFRKEHPDGHASIANNSAAFYAWLDDQTGDIRKAFEVNRLDMVDGNSAAYVVASWKASLADAAKGDAPAPDSKATLQARRDKQLVGSKSERPGGSSAVTSAPPADGASDQAHWDHFAAVDARKRAALR